MVISDGRHDRIVETDLLEDGRADLAMDLRFFKLRGRKAARLVEDVIGDGKFPDVMQKSPGSKSVDVGFTEAEDPAETDGVYLCAADMTHTNLIAGVDRRGQCFNRRQVHTAGLGRLSRFFREPLEVASICAGSANSKRHQHERDLRSEMIER